MNSSIRLYTFCLDTCICVSSHKKIVYGVVICFANANVTGAHSSLKSL